MALQDSMTKVIRDLAHADADAGKADGGNKQAGVRLRKACIQAEKDLKQIRKTSLEMSKS